MAIRGEPANDDEVNLKIHSEDVIKRFWQCSWRQQSSVFGDTLVGRDQVNLEVLIEGVWRFTWRV
jgi:hypothetical protein